MFYTFPPFHLKYISLYMKKATCLCMRQNLRNPAPGPYYFMQFYIFIFLKISKLTYFIAQKLYSKGYTSDDIALVIKDNN